MNLRTAPVAGSVSRSTFALAFGGALIFLYLRTFLLSGVPFEAAGDQIFFFARGARIAHGQVIYRDFFELVTPGTNLLYGAIFWVVGIHAWVLQAVSIAVGLSFCFVLTRIAERLVRGPLVLLPALLFLVFDFSNALDLTHHWYSTLAVMIAVCVLTGGASRRRIAIASLLCGVATLFTQTAGTFAFAAVVVYLLLRRRAEDEKLSGEWLAVTFLPFALIVCGVLGYYVYRAGLRTVFFDLVLFPPQFLTGDVNSPRTYFRQIPMVHGMGDFIRLIPVFFILLLVPYLYLFGLARLTRQRDMPDSLRHHLLLLHLVGLGLVFSVISGPRFFRLSTIAPPAILICTWLVSGQRRTERIGRNTLWVVAAIFAIFIPVRWQVRWHGTLDLPIGRTAFSDPQVYREFEWLAQRSKPGDTFFNAAAPGLYLSLRNPTAKEFLNDDEYSRPEQVAEVVRALQREPARYIVLQPVSTVASDPHDHSGPFREFVRENYRLAETFRLKGVKEYDEQLWEFEPRMTGQAK